MIKGQTKFLMETSSSLSNKNEFTVVRDSKLTRQVDSLEQPEAIPDLILLFMPQNYVAGQLSPL